MSAEDEKAAAKTQKQNVPDKEQLDKSVAAARKVVQAQSAAEALKAQAKKSFDPRERMRLLQEAYHKEVEAHGQSKFAKRLQSGPWQGAGLGGGIGGGVAMGLGTVVGTLVGGVAAVPTVLLGGLVGTSVGAIKGPFIKLGGGQGGTPMTDEQVRAQAAEEAKKLDQAVEKGAETEPVPPEADVEAVDAADITEAGSVAESPARRKPRKLQVRSGLEASQPPEKRKPRKLQVRSTPTTSDGV